MIYLLLAVAAVAVGPAVLGPGQRRPLWAAGLDGFVAAAIPLLVFLQFVPSAIEERQPMVLAALIVGFMAPPLVERFGRRVGTLADRWGLALGVAGLGIHAALDGAALATVGPFPGGNGVALAIALHRIPVGLAIWWLASGMFGARGGIAALVALMSATVAGYGSGALLASGFGQSVGVLLFQAAVGGSLIHVAAHQGHHSGVGQDRRRAEGMGASAAIALVLSVQLLSHGGHTEPSTDFLQRLFILGLESAPALLLAYLCAGLLSAFLPGSTIRWMGRGGAFSQASRGVLLGLPFPVRSGGVVPIYRGFIDRGVPPAAAMALLVATPVLGIDAILLSIPFLGLEVTLLRVSTAGVAALLIGWWVGGRLPAHTAPTRGKEADGSEGRGARVGSTLRVGTGEIVDHSGPWILLGLAVAAVAAPWLEGGWLAQLPSLVGVLLFAAIGFPTYFCAASATPIVAALIAGGLSPGAGIAFLITGPAMEVSTLGVIAGLHGRRAGVAFATVLVGFAVAAGLTVDAFFGGLQLPILSDVADGGPSWIALLSLVGLAGLFGASLVRRGPRAFAGEIRAGLGGDDGHHHHHGHDHDHPHGHPHDRGTARSEDVSFPG